MPMSSGRKSSSEMQRRRDSGVALILVLMVAVTASAFVILHALNTQTARETGQRLSTVEALAQARRALIGYAVGYADGDHAARKGPGRLPCPDRAGNSQYGAAEGVPADCRVTNHAETGLLPFSTLGLTELRDGSGAPLWYAVAENYRSMATAALNSASPASLKVDATDDVVAVIIAPGKQLPGQIRGSGSTYTPAAWLEGENASPGDNRFTRTVDAVANDTVMTITRAELMLEVEKVVNKEVASALGSYRHDPDGDDDAAGADPDCAPGLPDCDDGLPWLAPRNASTAAGVVGIGVDALARVPLTELGKPFNAEFGAVWSVISAGTLELSGDEPPEVTCLRHNSCTQNYAYDLAKAGPGFATTAVFSGPVLGMASPPWAQGTCTARRGAAPPYRLKLSCTTSYDFAVSGRSLRRVYLFELDGNTSLVAPSASERRTVVVVRAFGSWTAGTTGRITITDFENGTAIGKGQFNFSSLGPTDSVVVLNVPFDLEVPSNDEPDDRHASPGALPRWFLADQWQQSTLVQFAPSQAPGYSGLVCQTATSCLTLHLLRPGETVATIISGVRGVVVSAGPPLPAITSPATPAQTRPSSDLRDYLEGINTTEPTTLFERRDPSNSFNDQILDLAP